MSDVSKKTARPQRKSARVGLYDFEDDRKIVAVTRKRLAVDYFGRDYQPRLVSISLARVAGYFEELPS